VALSDVDRNLLERCLNRQPHSWEDFVDRFTGLVVHVINHSAQSRSIRLGREDFEDLASEVFLAVLRDDFAVLRHFRGHSSLATYLTVVARRVVVRELLARKQASSLAANHVVAEAEIEPRIHDREEVDRLLEELEPGEAHIVRLFHLDGLSYHEISQATGITENSIGPLLARAREKMRRTGEAVG
jgi:RNA polymerase sigma-70 factor (ECF subfamily)